MSIPRFLIATPAPGAHVADLPADEAHHLRTVLRLGRGDVVRVFDGAGREWEGAVVGVTPRGASVALDRPMAVPPEPPVAVTLAIGLLKGDQMDAVVRDATALGAAVVTPLLSTRVVAPARARVTTAHERWRRVALQSAKQCGRAVVPAVTEPAALDDVVTADGYAARVILAEPETGDTAAAGAPAKPASSGEAPNGARPRVLLLVGPEGGWTADEVRFALSRGCQAWRLGPRTLKAELAPAVALAALWAMWGWE